MSTNEDLTPATDLSTDQAITIQPSGMAAYSGGGDWPMPLEGESSSGAVSPVALLHALRRHWLIITATGVAAAAVMGTLLWWVQKPKYEASATLLIAPTQPHVMNSMGGDEGEHVPNEFEIFRDTQMSLLTQRFVLTTALRNQKLKNLASIQREDARHNTLAWLTSELQVGLAKKNTGIMNVSATLPDGNEAATIVNAVVEAYMDEVVNKDRQQRRERLDSLQGISAQKENEVRIKKEQLKRELENNGGGDDQTAVARGNMALTTYAEYQRELQKMRWDRTALIGRKEETQKMLEAVKDIVHPIEIPELDIIALLNAEPEYRDIAVRLQSMRNIAAMVEKTYTEKGKLPPNMQRTLAQYQADTQRVEDLKDRIKLRLRDAKRIEFEKDISRMDTQILIANQQITDFEKQVDSKGRDADAAGRSTVNAQMARAEIENLERILHGVADERERLRVELESQHTPLRVRILGDPSAPAAVSDTEAGAVWRYLFIALGSFAGLVLPAISIVVWDLSKQRVNSPDEVSKKLKMSVMGTLPFIPANIMRRLGNDSQRSQVWKMRYTEAVDGVVARLLRNAESDEARVILVTSAMSGEGKTWLSTQLAMGLARAQRRTVLVDFDLRQPALDGALGLPLGPGICDALRGQGDVAQMVQPTETEYLSVVTAGSWSRQVLPALANGSVGAVLEQLREGFDFVILDSSPLLPIVDTRLVCQHVDAVLLSVLRDVSEASKVQAAQETLDAFGVARVDTVVTGGEQFGNAKSLLYQAALVDGSHARLTDQHVAAGDVPRGDDASRNN